MIRFTIPYPPAKQGKSAFCRRFGLNAYYAGKPWPQRRRDAQELHQLAVLSMRRSERLYIGYSGTLCDFFPKPSSTIYNSSDDDDVI